MTEQTPVVAATADYPLVFSDKIALPGEAILVGLNDPVAFYSALNESKNKIFVGSGKDGQLGMIGTVIKVGDRAAQVVIEARGRIKEVKPRLGGELSFVAVEEIDTAQVTPQLAALAKNVVEEFWSAVGADLRTADGAPLDEVRRQGLKDHLTEIARERPHHVVGALAQVVSGVNPEQKREMFETVDFEAQLDRMLAIIADMGLEQRTQKDLQNQQSEFLKSKKIETLQKELAELKGDNDGEDDFAAFERKIAASGMTDEARIKCEKELKKLTKMNPQDPSASKVYEYLDEMLSFPWKESSELVTDLGIAEQILDADHYGLEKVKERIVEQLAVQMKTAQTNGSIICLAGPPGVGKTSIGKSIAKATGRKFVRLSLGGVSDEAAIRGHRTTYVGAMPGKIMRAMKEAGTINPVIQLDEIDKMGQGNQSHGDPTAALLEVLDPAQNNTFVDQYTDVKYDLSNVMFVASANYLEQVPAPLRDRMEIITISGYTDEEKLEIAKRYLVPKALENSGLTAEQFSITDAAIAAVVDGYTLEAGVRGLEKQISNLVRKAVVQVVKTDASSVAVTTDNLEELAGPRKIEREKVDATPRIGHVNGLAVSGGMTGSVLPIEAVKYASPTKGAVEATGNLKETIKESVEYAYAYVRAHANELGITPDAYLNNTVHIKVDKGGVPADGPSAGLAITSLITSVLADIPLRGDVAITGEISVLGESGPIGGVDHKIDGALKGGITTVIIPEANLKDLANPEFPKKLKASLEIMPDANVDPRLPVPEGKVRVIPVKTIDEVFRHMLDRLPTPLTQDQINEAKQKGSEGLTQAFTQATESFTQAVTELAASRAFAEAAAVQQPAPANTNVPVAEKPKRRFGILPRRQAQV